MIDIQWFISPQCIFVDAQNYATVMNSKLYVIPLCLFYFAVKLW